MREKTNLSHGPVDKWFIEIGVESDSKSISPALNVLFDYRGGYVVIVC